MSLGLNKTKRRIASVKSTQKITKAMGMVASVKLKRCKDRFEKSLQYRDQIGVLLAKSFHYATKPDQTFTSSPEGAECVLYILVTSDLGLCAGYNSSLLKLAHEKIRPELDDLLLLGEKGKMHFLRDERFAPRILELPHMKLGASYRRCHLFARHLMELFASKKYARVELIYTHYVNSLRFEPSVATLLPIQPSAELPPHEEYAPPIYEPQASDMLQSLLPYYLAGSFYNYLAESELSEQSSRRMAMDNANDNADELLEKLTIEYNKARQSAITQEIVEVVSGASNAT